MQVAQAIKVTDALIINRMISLVGVDNNIDIVIIIVFGLNGSLKYAPINQHTFGHT